MKRLLILLFVLPCLVSKAQNELHFNNLSIKEGLPEGMIKALLKDKEGYFWIGTNNALVRYDGYNCKRYNLRGAVGLNIVYRIYEDRKHNIWIGNYNGLSFYNRATDSIENRSFLIPQKGKSGYVVNDFQDDSKGNIWISFYERDSMRTGHIALCHPDTKEVTFFGNKEEGAQHINAVEFDNPFVDTQDKLWFETPNAIFEYNEAKRSFKGHYFDTTNQTIDWFSNEDTANHVNVWFRLKNKISANKNEICEYNVFTNTLKVFPKSASGAVNLFTDKYIGPNFIDSKHRIWFGTRNGLTLFDSATNQFIDFTIKDKPDVEGSNAVAEICEDTHANFWCLLKRGLAYFNTASDTFTTYRYEEGATDGIIDDQLSHISLDNYGLPLFGFELQGLQWVNKNRSSFALYDNHLNKLHSFKGGSLLDLAETANGNFWIGAVHGLYYWQPQLDSFTCIHFLKDVKDVLVNAVRVAGDGTVWFSVWRTQNKIAGLYHYNPVTKELKIFRHKDDDSLSLATNDISDIIQDDAGTIWIGTDDKGLCRFNAEAQNFTSYPYIRNNGTIIPAHDTLDDKSVSLMHKDKEGVLWLGTGMGGLNKFSPQTDFFTDYLNKLPGFFSVITIYDDKNTVWAGTYVSGLFSINKKTDAVKKFTEANGLLSDRCGGLQEDNHNNLWVASPRGFSILNINTGKIHHLTLTDGLPVDPSLALNAFYKTKEGKFLFSCDGGFITFNPDDFGRDTVVPILHIETVAFTQPQKENKGQTDSLIVRYGKENIHLRYNENRLTFTYVGLLYQNASAVQYAYKLDGYDKSWIEAGTQRSATYTNLSPGTYTFHVKAANGDGVWTRKEDSITVIISPPWWKTWWAYLFYAVAFITAVSSFIVYRSRNLQRQNKILEDKVAYRTQQLNNKTEDLNKSLEDLKSTQAQLIQSEKMASLGELTAGIAHEIQNPLNFVNNFSELSNELLDEMNLEMDKGDIEEAKLISNDIKQNLEKINHHGKRADSIVKGMLQHSRQSKGVREAIDINALCDEYLRLSYHGLKAKGKNFNADFNTEFDETIGSINIVPQDMGRVLLNLFNNAFYAVNEKKKTADENYKPLVAVQTKRINNKVEIIVSDNGSGIPQNIIDKIFQPFFTTKPTGQGTGLGLSLSYDIITKEHNGTIKVESHEGEGTVFVITLPQSV